MGRDTATTVALCHSQVSIHTPMWGVTGLKCGPGWLGSNKRKDAVLRLLGLQLENLTDADLIAIGEQRRAESEQRKAD